LELKEAGAASGLSFTPNSNYLATASVDRIEIRLWDVDTGRLARTLSGFETAAPVFAAVFAPDDKTMAWIARGTVQFMDAETGKLGARLEFEDFVGAAQFTPDSKALVTSSAKTVNNQQVGVIEVWDAATGERKQELVGQGYFSGLSVSRANGLVASSSGSDILFWDWTGRGAPVPLAAGAEVSELLFSHDGSALAVLTQEGKLVIWRAP
jgi:WD40 repeat protein